MKYACQCSIEACNVFHGGTDCKNVATRELSTNENQAFCVPCQLAHLKRNPQTAANEFRAIPAAAYRPRIRKKG
jgi:hypothetical protein